MIPTPPCAAPAPVPAVPTTLEPPGLEHLCDLTVAVSAALSAGDGPFGLRRVIPITGGIVRGPRMSGRVMAAGADFQLITGGGTAAHLDARYLIELDDGSTIFVHNTALRHARADVAAALMRGEAVAPQDVYFSCQPRFETGDARWSWLQERQFVGRGQRLPDAVKLSFWMLT
jgi:hypothetical protein